MKMKLCVVVVLQVGCMLDNAQTQVGGHGEGRRGVRGLKSGGHHFRHPGLGLARVTVHETVNQGERRFSRN